MASLTFIAEVQSTYSGPLNPAYIDFTFLDGVHTREELASDVFAYLAMTLKLVGETGVTVTGMNTKLQPAGALTPVTFPTTEVAAWAVYLPTAVPANTAWGQALLTPAAQYSSGRGDSVCMTTKGVATGRRGIGRHFLPFLSKVAIGFDGLIDPGYAGLLETNYDTCFRGLGAGSPPAWSSAGPEVYSRTYSTATAITSVKCQRVPSRLRTRTK